MSPGPDPRAPRRPSTIRDVAALAGVSKSTASRALLGHGGVSPDNLEKVRRAIEELDFVPNQIARSLTVSSPAMLGLYLRNSRAPFYARLAGAFESAASTRGYEVLSVASGEQPGEASHRSLMVLAGLRTAGLVVAAPTIHPATIRHVAARVPLVLVGQMGQAANPEVPFVAPDPDQGEVLIEHVVGLGHESVALLAPSPSRSPTQWARIVRMQQQLEARRLEHRVEMVDRGSDLDKVVAELHRAGATVILCKTDETALDVIAAAGRLGLSVPGDLSVAGYDGVPPFDHPAIGLTTFRIPISAMAAAAVDVVDRIIRGEPVDRVGTLLPGELVPGRTTGPPPQHR